AEALGLLSRPLPFLRGLPLEMALELFTEASRNARGRGEAIEALAEGWRVRLLQEFGGLTPGEGAMPDVQLLGLRGRAEVMTGVDRRAPGRGEVFPFRTGALPIADEELATVEAEAFLALGRRVGVQIAPRLRGSDAELPRVDLVVGAGSWTLAAGRQPVGFGKARPGGMVLGGTASIDRIEVKSGRPTTVEQ